MPSLWERLPSLCRALPGLAPAAGEVPHWYGRRSNRDGTRRLPEQDLPKQPRGWMCVDVARGEKEGSPGSRGCFVYQTTLGVLEFQSFGPDFNNLIDPHIRRNVKIILLRNPRRDKPSDEVQQRQPEEPGSDKVRTGPR